MFASNIKQVIGSAIHHIEQSQEADGSFKSLSSFSQTNFQDAISYATTFFTSTILSCLNPLAETRFIRHETPKNFDAIRQEAAKLLLKEMNPGWSWNYWARGAGERRTKPYPDDLDDTFMALAALKQYDINLINEEVLASVVKMLTALEAHEGGPYRTWLVGTDSDKKWKDIDIVVNSTIAYFLSLVDIRLPRLQYFLEDAIKNDRMKSPYYPSIYQIAYFVSRSYQGAYQKRFAERIAAELKEDLDATPLECAMGISSLVNLDHGEKISENFIKRFSNRLEKEGWRPYAFCIDPSRSGKRSYAGASALTAALCMEALIKYSGTVHSFKLKSEVTSVITHRAAFAEGVKTLAKHECATAGTLLGKIAQEKIEAVSDEKIMLLAYDFQQALGKRGGSIPTRIIQNLSLANLYGWLAYTIYDDLLDGEGETLLLSVANFFHRALIGKYIELQKEIPDAMDLLRTTMDKIDEANTWEQVCCRRIPGEKEIPSDNLPDFRNYENLANRSVGHAMGPLAELLFLGYDKDSKEFSAIEKLFRHYLIARQLHDDAHDWAEDLVRGQINRVAALILKQYIPVSGPSLIAIDLGKFRYLFWTNIIDETVQMITSHIAAARSAREESGILNSLFMEQALSSLEHGAEKALEERNKVLNFLDEYQKIPLSF